MNTGSEPAQPTSSACCSVTVRHVTRLQLLVGLLVVAGYAAAVVADEAKYKAASTIVALLPTFCMHQYVDDVDGPEYSFPPECGPGMNHYCPGLVKLHQANRTVGNKRERIGLLERAREDTKYTLKAMENFPTCPARKEVEATLVEINGQLRAYNVR